MGLIKVSLASRQVPRSENKVSLCVARLKANSANPWPVLHTQSRVRQSSRTRAIISHTIIRSTMQTPSAFSSSSAGKRADQSSDVPHNEKEEHVHSDALDPLPADVENNLDVPADPPPPCWCCAWQVFCFFCFFSILSSALSFGRWSFGI